MQRAREGFDGCLGLGRDGCEARPVPTPGAARGRERRGVQARALLLQPPRPGPRRSRPSQAGAAPRRGLPRPRPRPGLWGRVGPLWGRGARSGPRGPWRARVRRVGVSGGEAPGEAGGAAGGGCSRAGRGGVARRRLRGRSRAGVRAGPAGGRPVARRDGARRGAPPHPPLPRRRWDGSSGARSGRRSRSGPGPRPFRPAAGRRRPRRGASDPAESNV